MDYAVKAIKIFRKMEMATATMKKRKRRKYIKKLQREYEEDFKEPLKKLTKTQEIFFDLYYLVCNLMAKYQSLYFY